MCFFWFLTPRPTWSHKPVEPLHGGGRHPGPGTARQGALGAGIKRVLMVHQQQLSDTLVADAVLAGQDQRVGEELLTDGADQLPLNVLDRNLVMEAWLLWKLPHRHLKLQFYIQDFCMRRHNSCCHPGTGSNKGWGRSEGMTKQFEKLGNFSVWKQGYSCLWLLKQ